MTQQFPPAEEPKQKWGFFESLVSCLGFALVACNLFLLWKTDRLSGELRSLDASTQAQLTTTREVAAASTVATRRALDALEDRIDEVRGLSNKASTEASQAHASARRHADRLVKELAEQQKRDQQALAAQLGEVKQSAETTSATVTGLLTDVSNVRGEVTATKGDLDRTVADLRSVRGDLGVQSGLIATNARELALLKALGERNYYEFSLPKTSRPQTVANIAVQLKKADVKRNRFTIELIADDKRVEKRDRTINEPVQFYMARARQPYELVVNEVTKDRIVGYLATPKMTDAR